MRKQDGEVLFFFLGREQIVVNGFYQSHLSVAFCTLSLFVCNLDRSRKMKLGIVSGL